VLSIVTATYNSASRIEHLAKSISLIKSCLAKPSDLAWYVQDNCSTDNTLEIVRTYVPSADIESRSDRSLFDAWNYALSRIAHGWVMFLGDDDNVTYDFVIQVVKIPYDISICIASSVTLTQNGSTYGYAKVPFRRYLPGRTNAFCHPGFAFPRGIYPPSAFDPTYSLISDLIFYRTVSNLRIVRTKGKGLVSMSVDGSTGKTTSSLMVLSEYFRAVGEHKVPLSLTFILRKLLMVFSLRYGIAPFIKHVRWRLF
jgi:glycosyltransferase involved in cell wall biosynthesis